MSSPVEFLYLYNCFLTYAKEQIANAEVRTFAKDGKCTDAEFKKGKNKLNAFMHSEYSTWWDAFEAEANEDTDPDSPSAEERFSDHCAKKLSSKTGLSRSSLSAVVGAWLSGMNA
jgi:hypothetical protein